ncbi:type II toxin-antitoxin system antitoxin SocA domain-containing protein [Terrimonas ferruginea]|uniref:type II toxin-antitoxin system antitoxin SocA domain-containing protein n=1 Tax=Terrimonas ferruginea TaxID=249 RepID=UPI00138AD5AC|nr:Panacea domain-containing protein [Terrimonas ferruginea]
MKTLFLLEEAAIKKYGFPFFGIDFQLWKHGPVAKDIFIDLSEQSPSLLAEFITRDENNPASFKALKEFCDDEFSDNDIQILEYVSDFVKDKSASALVKQTHGLNSLWRKSAIKNGVLELLENELKNSTEINIDFSILFEHDKYLRERFEEMKETLEFSKQLKK